MPDRPPNEPRPGCRISGDRCAGRNTTTIGGDRCVRLRARCRTRHGGGGARRVPSRGDGSDGSQPAGLLHRPWSKRRRVARSPVDIPTTTRLDAPRLPADSAPASSALERQLVSGRSGWLRRRASISASRRGVSTGCQHGVSARGCRHGGVDPRDVRNPTGRVFGQQAPAWIGFRRIDGFFRVAGSLFGSPGCGARFEP